MPIQLEEKKTLVAEVNANVVAALSAVVADYRGLSVAQMTQLRVEARKQGVYLKVVRNTLARRAVEGTAFECLKDAFVGPSLLALAKQEPGAAARLLRDFAKANSQITVRGISLGGRLIGADALDAVAALPTRDQAIATLLATLQAPAAKLARTLLEIPGKFVRTLAAVRDQKSQP
jgi:large subunit ribosomal protein L10